MKLAPAFVSCLCNWGFHMPYVRPRILACLALSVAVTGQSAELGRAPSDAEIRQILVNRIDTQKQGVGIVVGVIDAKGRRVIAYGGLEKGDRRPLDGNTVFEIGSITKVFTALLLADMAQHGEVKLDDPISKYLPPFAKIPERSGHQITLVDLATHTSGLPRMPANFRPKDPANPYADFTDEQLYSFLSSYELIRDIGVKFEYSNLGFGLLGQGLAWRAGTDYETLVKSRVCEPLDMPSTQITMSPDMERRFAAGHSADLVTVSRWDIPTLAGAGALRSSANDLLKFLAASMGYTKTALAPAMKAMLAVRRPTGQPFIDTGLGWTVDRRGGGEIIWKNGGTGGYRTFIGYAPRSGVGIVALSNAETESGVDDLGLHLLDARYPLTIPAGSPREAAVDFKLLDRYVGYYELAPNFILSVTREGDQLYVQATGQTRAAVYGKSDREFFYKVVDAQITFEGDAQGKASGLVLHQNGRDQRAARIEESEAKELEAAVERRFKDQTPQPGGEAALRRLIDQLQHRQVNYEEYTPEFATVARQQETTLESLIESFGALQSVAFKGVGPGGADIYRLEFNQASVECRILLAPDGKVAFGVIRQLP
jgi:D-alanyl-D-alanine-carboxypeptidase/D-alanyl-D-alanine-endopeptidase